MKSRLPIIYSFIAGVATVIMIYPLLSGTHTDNAPMQNAEVHLQPGISIQRIKGYNLVRPLLSVEPVDKAATYARLTQQVNNFIHGKIQNRELLNASFYLKDLENNEWTGLNENDPYQPGSLLKVPVLLAFLRQEEIDHGLLDKQVFYNTPEDTMWKVWVPGEKQLQPGRFYTNKELLHWMIVYSDNNATTLLQKQLPFATIQKLFTDLGLRSPDLTAPEYPISARQYSVFMKAIYNCTYLNVAHSEFAADLLSKSSYTDGFRNGIPASVTLIEKFGEAGTPSEHHLSESAIFYLNDKAYELVVMTKGSDLKTLSTVLTGIAQLIYSNIK